MTMFIHNSEPLKVYRAAGMELHEFSLKVEKELERAGESGYLAVAKEALSELTLRTSAFKDLRARLAPLDLFIAKYCVMAVDEHTVSLVIPKGVSRLEMLKEALSTSIELYEESPGRYTAYRALQLYWLEKCASESGFTEVTHKSLSLLIDGDVTGSNNLTHAEQEARGWNNAALQDLAVAHSAFYLLTGKSLFRGRTVRVAGGGALNFSIYGLVDCNGNEESRDSTISASRSLSVPNYN